MVEYKKQHYVPETYLKAWEDETGKLYKYEKDSNKLITHSAARKVLFKKDLYTKTIDDLPILNDEEKKQIFSCLNDYSIYYNHNGIKKCLKSFNDYENYYYDFDNWYIIENTGQVVDNEKLKKEINKHRNTDIETDWHYIEDILPDLIQEINYIVNKKQDSLTILHREKLIEFMILQKNRTLYTLNKIEELAGVLLGSFKNDFGQENFKELIQKNSSMFFKKQIALYQKSKKGIISDEIKLYKKYGSIIFMKSIGKDFISSDNPVFHINDSNFYKGKYNAVYFPITPKLMIALCRGSSPNNYKYIIGEINYQKVRKFNKKIKDNSFKYYITNYKK